jgi:hypothetical protein
MQTLFYRLPLFMESYPEHATIATIYAGTLETDMADRLR